MLINSVNRYDVEKIVKLCCIEQIRKTNPKVLQQITAVPALLLFGPNNSKELLFGKEVFDFLLLPNRGRLMQPSTSAQKRDSNKEQNSIQLDTTTTNVGEPMGFDVIGGQVSGNFTFIENDDQINYGQSYAWSSLSEDSAAAPSHAAAQVQAPVVAASTPAASGLGLETRSKVELPSMDTIMAQRDNDVAFMRPKAPPPTDLRI